MLYLKEINHQDMEKEFIFVRDMPEDENGLTNRWHGVSYEDFKGRVLDEMIGLSRGENLPEGYVPETILFLWDEDVIVGQFRIRHFLCESLRTGGGHIGYFIKKEFRNRGYGSKGLGLALQRAWAIVPEREIYLRVRKSNPASLKVMRRNGGYIKYQDETSYYVRIRK